MNAADILNNLTDDGTVLSFAIWGCIAAVVFTVFKLRLKMQVDGLTWALLTQGTFEVMLNGIVGAFAGLLFNHNIMLAALMGFISYSSITLLTEWVISPDFRKLVLEFLRRITEWLLLLLTKLLRGLK